MTQGEARDWIIFDPKLIIMDLSLGQKIKEYRMRAAVSQEELAARTGLSLRTIQRIENEETQPRGDSLRRLAEALGVEVEVLMEGVDAAGGDIRGKDTSGGDVREGEGKPLREDRGFLALLALSPLTFILFPGLGIVAPLIFWIMKKEEVREVKEIGREILNFQITWLLGFGVAWFLLLYVSSMNAVGGLFMFPLLIMVFYAWNAVLTVVCAIRVGLRKMVVYAPSIPFIRR